MTNSLNQEAQEYTEEVFRLMDGMQTDQFLTILTHCILAVMADTAPDVDTAIALTSAYADTLEETGAELLPAFYTYE